MSTSRLITINITDNTLYLDIGNFKGDAKIAKEFIQKFCDQNKVTTNSFGHGYGEIFVNGKWVDEITPYGIDVNMMIGYCGGSPASFEASATPSYDNSTQTNLSQYNDSSVPNLSIRKFSALQLKISEEKVIDTLYHALPAAKQNQANRELLEKAANYKVNASGAIILMVNTNNGLQLIYANSQRRKKVVSSNGSCEAKESMADTAIREFVEESGNPTEKGILCTTVKNRENCRSLEVTNKIGRTAEEIANRIVETQADKNKLYINMSSLYINADPVNVRILEQEIAVLNEKLKKSAAYYKQAVLLLYGDRDSGVSAANLSDGAVKTEASKFINNFKENCPDNISSNFANLFSLNYDDKIDSAVIKDALSAIVDLTENNEMGLISRAQLEALLSIDLNQKENKDKFKNEYFTPSFENILAHKGKSSPGEFLANLEKFASKASKVSLGIQSGATGKVVSTSDTYAGLKPGFLNQNK